MITIPGSNAATACRAHGASSSSCHAGRGTRVRLGRAASSFADISRARELATLRLEKRLTTRGGGEPKENHHSYYRSDRLTRTYGVVVYADSFWPLVASRK